MFRRPRRRTRSASGSRTDRRCGPQGPGRKVRAPQGRTLGNTQEGRPSDSATESKPPDLGRVRVKRWCKRPPDAAVTRHARHTPFGARPNREGGRPDHCLPGRLLEGTGNRAPRGMTVWCGQPHDRTRLIVRLPLVDKVFTWQKVQALRPTRQNPGHSFWPLVRAAAWQNQPAALPSSFCPGAVCRSFGMQPAP